MSRDEPVSLPRPRPAPQASLPQRRGIQLGTLTSAPWTRYRAPMRLVLEIAFVVIGTIGAWALFVP